MTQLQGKTALVTGANGFIGSRVASRLLAAGAAVRGLVRRPENHPELAEVQWQVVAGDFSDAAALPSLLAGVDVLVHCAASLGRDMAESLQVNAKGTRTLMEAALTAGVGRVVHISTVAVYDNDRIGTVVDENAPMLVRHGAPYGVGKAAAEREALAVAPYGLDIVILRPTRVLGGHATSSWGTKVPLGLKAGKLKLAGDGSVPFTYVHVDNLAEAALQAAVREGVSGQAYNVSDGHVTWLEYARYFVEQLGWPEPGFMPLEGAPAMFARGVEYDMAKAERELGYTRKHSFESAMAEQVAYLKATGRA